MNTLQKNRTPEIAIHNSILNIKMIDGRKATIDLKQFSSLKNATPSQLQNFELSPFGIHWLVLNEDLSFEGFFLNQS